MKKHKGSFLLSEGVVDTIAVYMILQKLITPFEKWDACKLGIIDKNGKKLKHPVTSKERDAWDMLTKFMWNFKLILQKFIGKSKFLTYFTAAVLLKDSVGLFWIENNLEKLTEDELSDLTCSKQQEIYNALQSLPVNTQKITEDNFEIMMYSYMPLIDHLISEEKIDQKRLLG